MNPAPAPEGNILAHLLRFGRLLRLMGVQVNFSQMVDLVHALEVVPITGRADFYHTARAVLVSRREEIPLFDQAFALYWRAPEPLGLAATPNRDRRRARLPSLPQGGEGLATNGSKEEPTANLSYSAAERLREKNFAHMSWEEVEAAKRAIDAMSWQISPRRTRRTRVSVHGKQLDLRRVTRDNLRFGGEPLVLKRRARRERPRPLVVLCDISGSMERYSRLLLHFIHAMSHTMREVEAFLFGTRLTRITHHLRHKEVDTALDEVGKVVQDWSGGTRIGDAIKHFNYHWARRVLGRGAVMLLISDGWDRGDTSLLAREMERLQRASHRLIWLNPFLGSEGYEPVQKGMAAALPFVDDFLPVHNLKSLSQLAALLGALAPHRPERKQRVRRAEAG